MTTFDPQITVEEALAETDGNQAALARALGITRASVNGWVRTGRTHLPAVSAYRFQKIFRQQRA